MVLKPRKQRIPYWAYMLLLFVLLVLSFYIIARFKIPIDGAGSKVENGKCTITAIRPDSPAEKAGLKIDDNIVYVESIPVTGKGHMELLEKYRAGDTLAYTILRDENELIKSVTLDSFWSQNPWMYLALYTLILIVCVSSIFILYIKPYDLAATLFFIFLQLLAIAQNFRFLFLDNYSSLIATIAFIFSFNLFGVVLLHFHLIFPQPVSFYYRIKGSLKVIYSLGFMFGLAVTVLLIRRHIGDSDTLFSVFYEYCRWSIYWMGLTLILALAVAIYQFRTSNSKLARKQLRLVLIGSVFGLITPIVFGIFPESIWRIERELHLLTTLELVGGIGTYIMTSFLAIAIFRYRLWNIEPFVRKALLYGAASAIISLSYIVLIFLVDLILVEKNRINHLLILAISSILFLLIRDVIQRVIDRFFYRESYDSATVVSEFEGKLTGIYRNEELKSKVFESLDEIFHFKSFLFAIKKNDLSYKPAILHGVDKCSSGREFEVSEEIDELIRNSKIFSVEELREKPRLFVTSMAELIVPLMEGDNPFGFFIIGPKLSEKSYSLQDTQVLSLLAQRVIALFHTASLYQKDLDRQLMLEHERTRIAKDIHDDVGASLTRISILSDILINESSDPTIVKRWLQQISDTCRNVTQEMAQIIWALNPSNDSMEGLITYIRRFALEYLEVTSVKCVFDLPEGFPGLDISVEVRRNIYLCIKESLHNVVKHADATQVDISLKVNGQGFIILIKDNGNGFDPHKLEIPGNGLINMKKRINAIGGELDIQTAMGEGTEVALLFGMEPAMKTFVSSIEIDRTVNN